MGELIQLIQPHIEPIIRQVETGVFLLGQLPADDFIEAGDFFTASDFAEAAERAGKSAEFGQGVMRDIALKKIAIECEAPGGINARGRSEMSTISGLMNNPYKIRNGSRNLMLLGHQLVHDVWANAEGSELVNAAKLPTIGKIGHSVVSQLFTKG